MSALKGHLYLSGAWLDVNLRLDTKKTYFEKDWTMLWNFVDHSRCCSQYNNRGRPIWFDLMRKRTFTFTMNRIFKWPPNIMRKVSTGTIWICIWISHWLCIISYEKLVQREKWPFKTHLPWCLNLGVIIFLWTRRCSRFTVRHLNRWQRKQVPSLIVLLWIFINGSWMNWTRKGDTFFWMQ